MTKASFARLFRNNSKRQPINPKLVAIAVDDVAHSGTAKFHDSFQVAEYSTA